VVIVDDANLDELIKNGKVLAASKLPLGRSSIGMAVRAGAPKPGIGSVEALKSALLQAGQPWNGSAGHVDVVGGPRSEAERP